MDHERKIRSNYSVGSVSIFRFYISTASTLLYQFEINYYIGFTRFYIDSMAAPYYSSSILFSLRLRLIFVVIRFYIGSTLVLRRFYIGSTLVPGQFYTGHLTLTFRFNIDSKIALDSLLLALR